MKYICFLLALSFLNRTETRTLQQEQFLLSSPAFVNKGVYPKIYTCDSLGISPPLSWKNLPKDTKSIAITMHHYPKDGDKHVYMVLYNIPVSTNNLNQGEKNIGEWGANTQNRNPGYAPPCSKGPGPKSYIITAYAISEKLNFNNSGRVGMNELLSATEHHTLAQSTLEVIYSR